MVLLLPGISHPLPGKEPGQSWPGSLYFITSLAFGHLPGAAQRCQKAVCNELREQGWLHAFSSCWLAAQLFVNFVGKCVLRRVPFQVGRHRKSEELESNFSRNSSTWILVHASSGLQLLGPRVWKRWSWLITGCIYGAPSGEDYCSSNTVLVFKG